MSGDDQPKALTTIVTGLNWIYDRTLHGVPGFEGAAESAHRFSQDPQADDAAIDALIRRHMVEAGAAGFLANLGGVLTLPIALPANLGSVLFIQLRMIAGIAHLRGYDIHSHQVKALAVACLAGSAAMDVFKDLGIGLGTRLSHQAIAHISGATLVRLNRSVGVLLVAKTGGATAYSLSKLVPLIGGAVGGTMDGLATKAIGTVAKRVFRS